MKISEPIGNAAWGALVVRLVVGAFFVLSGLHDIGRASAAFQPVGLFQELPPHVITLIRLLLPYFEIAAGTLLVMGFWTTLGAIFAAVIALMMVYPLGVFPQNSQVMNKDMLLLAGALSLLYSGAGALSVDGFRKSA